MCVCHGCPGCNVCVCVCIFVFMFDLTLHRPAPFVLVTPLHTLATPTRHPLYVHHQDRPAAVRTRLFGIAEACLWAGMLAGPLVGGALAEGYPYIGGGIQQSFVFSVLMFGLALFVAVFVVR